MLTLECVFAGYSVRGDSPVCSGPRGRAQSEGGDAAACPRRFTEGGLLWSSVLFIERKKNKKQTYLLYTDHLKFDSDIIFIKKVFQQHFFIKNSTL